MVMHTSERKWRRNWRMLMLMAERLTSSSEDQATTVDPHPLMLQGQQSPWFLSTGKLALCAALASLSLYAAVQFRHYSRRRRRKSQRSSQIMDPRLVEELAQAQIQVETIAQKLESFVDHDDSNVSSAFLDLGVLLLDIAEQVARINAIRLSQVGARITLLGADHGGDETVKQLVGLGLSVASRLLDQMQQREKEGAASSIRSSSCDIFVSYPGEEGEYASELMHKLEAAGLRVFMDKKSLQPLRTSSPRADMLHQALTSHVVACICTFHSVQKKWPLAELFCALARNQRAIPLGLPSPLFLDAFPGMTWLQSPAGRERKHAMWVNDVKILFAGLELPTMMPMVEEKTSQHVEAIAAHLAKFSKQPPPPPPQQLNDSNNGSANEEEKSHSRDSLSTPLQ